MAYKIIETCIGCTACTKRCPTEAITGTRNQIHEIDPDLCIDCGACGVVCPPESILDELGDVCRTFPRREWPLAIVVEDNCIGSGCELCIAVCPFDALDLDVSGDKVGDFFGVARVIERRCTGCRPVRGFLWVERDLHRPAAGDAEEAGMAGLGERRRDGSGTGRRRDLETFLN